LHPHQLSKNSLDLDWSYRMKGTPISVVCAIVFGVFLSGQWQPMIFLLRPIPKTSGFRPHGSR
ncbi:MAG: hypothetical protein J0H99_22715, partial [Rhodospirillales bacterium]|nr:hypothetical protein [Rhodospirillales bacterium]